MKKSNLIILVVFFVIILIGVAIFLYYKKTNNTGDSQLSSLVKKTSQTKIDPSSLDWEEITSSAQWEKRDSHAVIAYKNKIFLMGGVDATKRVVSPGNIDYGNAPHFSDVWSSEDGKNWQRILNNAPWGERRSMQLVDFKGKMWLMGGWGPEFGYRNDVWSSEDDIKWKLEIKSANWPEREGHQLLVFQNKLWLLGGVKYTTHQLFSDVWSSEDGKNWERATKSAEWSPRWDHMSVVFNNKLWTIGGMDFTDNLLKDIWSSGDGITWSLVNKNPPFESRQGFVLTDYKDRLWVINRFNVPLYGSGPNDVWFSEDGISWKKTTKDPIWTGREDVGSVVFKDRIWILGGMDKNWTWKNDIWASTANVENN